MFIELFLFLLSDTAFALLLFYLVISSYMKHIACVLDPSSVPSAQAREV